MDSQNLDHGANTSLFWDMEDFPVPEHLSSESLIDKVAASLGREGFFGSLSVHAYTGEKTPEERASFYEANKNLHVYEGVEKRARLNKMILKMLAFACLNPVAVLTNLLVVAKDIPDEDTELFSVFGSLRTRGYNVFFVVPDGLEPPPDNNNATLVWRWTSLLDDEELLDFEELAAREEEGSECITDEEGSECITGEEGSDVTSQGAEKRHNAA